MRKTIIYLSTLLMIISLVSANNLLTGLENYCSYYNITLSQGTFPVICEIGPGQTVNGMAGLEEGKIGRGVINHFGSAWTSSDDPAFLSQVFDETATINMWLSSPGQGAPAHFIYWSDYFEFGWGDYNVSQGWIQWTDGINTGYATISTDYLVEGFVDENYGDYWHMITITKPDNTFGNIKVYYDGTEQPLTFISGENLTINQVDWSAFCFDSQCGPWATSPYYMDEFAFADREWAQEDINNAYNSGTGLSFSEYSIESEKTETSAARRGDYYYVDSEGNIYTREQIEGTTNVVASKTTFATVVPYGEPITNPFNNIISWIKSFLSRIGITI